MPKYAATSGGEGGQPQGRAARKGIIDA